MLLKVFLFLVISVLEKECSEIPDEIQFNCNSSEIRDFRIKRVFIYSDSVFLFTGKEFIFFQAPFCFFGSGQQKVCALSQAFQMKTAFEIGKVGFKLRGSLFLKFTNRSFRRDRQSNSHFV